MQSQTITCTIWYFAEKMQHEPGSEGWRHNVPAAETTAPSLSETASVQSHPGSPLIHPGTSPDDVTIRQTLATLSTYADAMPASCLQQ